MAAGAELESDGPRSGPLLLLELPYDALLSVLQHVDAPGVLRLSLCSHAAARRLEGIEGLWRDLARRTLRLPPPPPPPPPQLPSPQADLPRRQAAERQSGGANGAGGAGSRAGARAAAGGTCVPSADATDSTSPAVVTGAAAHTAAAGPASPAHVSAGQDAGSSGSCNGGGGGCSAALSGRWYRAALTAHSRFRFWHSQHSLRLARVLGSPPPAPQQQPFLDAAWRAPPPDAIRVDPDLFRLSDADLYGLRVCEGSDIRVSGFTARCFSVRVTPSGARCRLLVVLASEGRPLVWLYFTALPSRPNWQDLDQGPADLDPDPDPGHAPTGQDHQRQPKQQPYKIRGQHSPGAQAPASLHSGGRGTAVSDATAAAAVPPSAVQMALLTRHTEMHRPEVWCCRGVASAVERDADHTAAAAAAAAAAGPAAATQVEVVAAAAAARVRLLAAAGRERLRCVAALAVIGRRRLAAAGAAEDLAALRAAGVAVVDLAGVVPRPGAADGGGGGGGGGDAGGPEGELVRELQRLVMADGGAGGDARMSARLREAVARLPVAAPHVRVLVLPVVTPRGGRAGVRSTPARGGGGGGGGAKCCAPRLLQLMVPVLSELRLAMTARVELDGVRPPRLPYLQRVVLVMQEGAEGPQAETALRNLAVSTLDRGTGMEED
ncbi:hypothetical protein PLESTF_000884700 [Pleodorina starrii]|nr:hypothetical protein PLESTF_000884700 [Pleodorina starrii]